MAAAQSITMTAYPLDAVEILDTSSTRHDHDAIPVPPKKAVAKQYRSIPLPPRHSGALELETYRCDLETSDKSRSNGQTDERSQTPPDLEMSRPSTPLRREEEGVDLMQSFSNPPMNKFRMLSVCLSNLCQGISDSAPGALLPYMEKHYSIGYGTVALIFVTNAVGFILAAFVVDSLRSRLGRGRTLMLAQFLVTCGYVPVVITPPWGVVVASFFLLGLGMAITLALGNVFAANLQNGTTMLGAMHGSYGIGGTIGPIIATAMVSRGSLVWSRFYLITLSFAVCNLGFAGWSFWNYEKELNNRSTPTTVERTGSHPDPATSIRSGIPSQLASMIKAFRSRTVALGALFIFAYQGAEVSISGWVISFLISTRNGQASSVGYTTAGFWGGITIGRFLLSHPAHRIGEKLFVYGMVIGATIFQILVWQVPNVVGDAVAVAIVGLLLGPVYPCATVIFSRNIDRRDQVSGLSVTSAFGSSGGAVFPFVTGILAQGVGTWVLHPIAISLFGVLMATWFCLPNTRKRTE